MIGVWGIVVSATYYESLGSSGKYRYCNVGEELRAWWVANAVLGTIGFLMGVPIYIVQRQIAEGGASPFKYIAGVQKQEARKAIVWATSVAFFVVVLAIMVGLFVVGHVVVFRLRDDRVGSNYGVNELTLFNATGEVEAIFPPGQEALGDGDNQTIYLTNLTAISFTTKTPISGYALTSSNPNPNYDVVSWELTSEGVALHTRRIPDRASVVFAVNCTTCTSYTITPTGFGQASCGNMLSNGAAFLIVMYAVYGLLLLQCLTPRLAKVARSV
eukprot:TRINITY_DN14864_c0_g1_i1.p1 TRINITY_DN14864_c0_g1~~TRINITY_DN14864_c0_g1_i1.p1  ORF type:complete len:272 (+),score=49.07 TRINITY_DN14864_c0_g1_i1:90-905(+)